MDVGEEKEWEMGGDGGGHREAEWPWGFMKGGKRDKEGLGAARG